MPELKLPSGLAYIFSAAHRRLDTSQYIKVTKQHHINFSYWKRSGAIKTVFQKLDAKAKRLAILHLSLSLAAVNSCFLPPVATRHYYWVRERVHFSLFLASALPELVSYRGRIQYAYPPPGRLIYFILVSPPEPIQNFSNSSIALRACIATLLLY